MKYKNPPRARIDFRAAADMMRRRPSVWLCLAEGVPNTYAHSTAKRLRTNPPAGYAGAAWQFEAHTDGHGTGLASIYGRYLGEVEAASV